MDTNSTTPSLASLIGPEADAPDAPAAMDASPAAAVKLSPAEKPAEDISLSTPAGFSLRDKLAAVGADPSSFETDDDAFDALVDTLGSQYARLSELDGDQGYQSYQQQREQFQAYLKSQEKPAETPAATETPATPQSKSASAIHSGLAPEISQAIQANLLTQNDKGFYEPAHPSMQAMADEANKARVAEVQFAKSLISSPRDTLRPLLEELMPGLMPQQKNEAIEALQKDLAEIKAQFAAQQEAGQQQSVKQWVSQNEDTLFTEADGKRDLTAYGKAYQKWEREVAEEYPKLTSAQRHGKVLQRLKTAGVSPEKAEKTTKANGDANGKNASPTMMERARSRAAATTTRSNGDPLQELAGKMPADSPGIPTGRAGFPSLNRIIAQYNSALGAE